MSYHRITQPLSELHKVLELLSLDEGYIFGGLHTARMAASGAFIMVKLKGPDNKCFEFTFSAERVNRKFDNLQRLAQNGDTMPIDYTARALKSAATRKAKAAAAKGDIPGHITIPETEPLATLALVNDHAPAPEPKAKAAKTPKAKAAPVPKPTKAEKSMHPCMCGCGTEVGGKFAIGHDAKLHSLVSKAAEADKKLSAELRKLAGAYILQRWPEEAKSVL